MDTIELKMIQNALKSSKPDLSLCGGSIAKMARATMDRNVMITRVNDAIKTLEK